MKTKIGNTEYVIKKPPLKRSIDGVQFLLENYGEGISILIVKLLDSENREKEVTSDLFEGVFKTFKSNRDVLKKTLDQFLSKEFITTADGKELNKDSTYENEGLFTIFRLVVEVIKQNYLDFFLLSSAKKNP